MIGKEIFNLGMIVNALLDVRMTVPFLYLLLAYLSTPIHTHPSVHPCYADWLGLVWPPSLNIWRKNRLDGNVIITRCFSFKNSSYILYVTIKKVQEICSFSLLFMKGTTGQEKYVLCSACSSLFYEKNIGFSHPFICPNFFRFLGSEDRDNFFTRAQRYLENMV